MKRLLLHICCAPCSCHIVDVLKKEYEVSAFFYNPNIQPPDEYEIRLSEMKRFAKETNLNLIEGTYDKLKWEALTLGYEKDKEGGRRCELCFKMRLLTCKDTAEKLNFDLFTTTLSVSPQKNANLLNQIGKSLEKEGNISYLEANFKKKDGFKLSVEKSKDHNLIRQNYCGCKFSKMRRDVNSVHQINHASLLK